MPINDSNKQIVKLTFLNFIATLSARAGSANIFVYNSSEHIPDSFKLVEEFHGQLKIGGGKKRVLLDRRENGKRRRRRNGGRHSVQIFQLYETGREAIFIP